MAPTDDLASHTLRVAVRRIRLARETVNAGERLRHLQDALALLNSARGVIERLLPASAQAVAGVPLAVIPDDVTMMEFIVDAQDETYGHG